ncbi:Cys/Met metabolism PLP-dependent enzyme-domain-containing protein [Paraphysoderma sedebokerense]|nr:Cys/Met metabolism PLP-dependent enzyme-domain-containing protein [Paraphysoderma sedebokerense]KAI9139941.1 Cys/Met metabolism PLP-dependent enzyme-domain-containing protein [Paraphysoderma sedebokerense]
MSPPNSPPAKSFSGIGTAAVHAGQHPDPVTGAVIPALSLSTTFKQKAAGEHTGFEYSRSGNPTRNNFEEAVAAVENGKFALAFASGSATTASIVNSLPHGSHIISVNDVYGGTYRYFTKVAPNLGYEASFVDMYDPKNVEKYIKPNTRMVWIETPTNPTLRLVDIAAVAEIAHRHPEISVVVDNTFMSPYFQRPLTLGADIVVHSVTKYINGHSDAVMGVLVTNSQKIYDHLKFYQNAIGAVPSAFDCFLANRGLKTLHLRMQQHQKNALAIAKFLSKSQKVTEVIYPGLESHKQHELAKRQMTGFGGMISFRIKGNLDSANKFLQNLKYFTLAESLGGVESLAELPAVMTHGSVSAADRAALGITDTLVRLSVGIEETEDLIEDVSQALDKSV